MTKPTEAELDESRRRFRIAAGNAKLVLKPGDRLRVTKCPGTRRTITFAGWNGRWIVSKSGINDYAPSGVDMVNGKPVDFGAMPEPPAAAETQGEAVMRCSCCSRTYDPETGKGEDTGLGLNPLVTRWVEEKGWGVLCVDCGAEAGPGATKEAAVMWWNQNMAAQIPAENIEPQPAGNDPEITF